MELLVETVRGFEEECIKETKEITKEFKKSEKVFPGIVKTVSDDFDDIYRINYSSGTINRVVLLLNSFSLEKPSDAYENIDFNVEEFMEKDQSFAVRVEREGEHSFSSVDVARETGQKIVDNFKNSEEEQLSVDLDNPDIVFRIYLFDERCFFGIDTTGKPLNDRNYIEEPEVPPILANCLVRTSSWSPGDKLLDPFTRQGVVAIEAGRIDSGAPNTKRKFSFLESKYFSNKKYAEIAKKINDNMGETSSKIIGSDKDTSEAEMNAENANVNVEFEKVTALEQDLNGYHVVYDTPFLPEKSKRKQIAEYMRRFEKKISELEEVPVTCTSRFDEFYRSFEKTKEVGWKTFEALVFKN